jgi:hypothetical protein
VSVPAYEAKGLKPAGQWNRLRIAVVGNKSLKTFFNGTPDLDLGGDKEPLGIHTTGAFVLHPEGEMDFGNLFVRELKK